MGQVGRPTHIAMRQRVHRFWRHIGDGLPLEDARLEAGLTEAQLYRKLRERIGDELLVVLLSNEARKAA